MTIPKIINLESEYFTQNQTYKEVLDENDLTKQARRNYFLALPYNNKMILVPLRTNCPRGNRFTGKISYPLPSQKRQNAGLYYRKCIILSDEKYISEIKDVNFAIPRAQSNRIIKNFQQITKEIATYIEGYIKLIQRNQKIEVNPRYRYSTLINFHQELKIVVNSFPQKVDVNSFDSESPRI